jgi:hypothetical protein
VRRHGRAYAVGNNITPTTPGCFRQSIVLGRKRNAAAHGKFEIAGVISAQPFAASQFEDGAQGVVGRLLVDHDRKPHDQGDEFAGTRRRDAPIAFAEGESIGQFQMPQRGNLSVLVLKPV